MITILNYLVQSRSFEPFGYFAIIVNSCNTLYSSKTQINKWKFHANNMKIKNTAKTNERKTEWIIVWDLMTADRLISDTPTRKKNIMICFIFMGKTESRVYKSDENRAKMRPDGTVSKNRWDVPKIPFSKLWCRHSAAFNVPCAKTIGPNMIAITVGFMTSELHKFSE